MCPIKSALVPFEKKHRLISLCDKEEENVDDDVEDDSKKPKLLNVGANLPTLIERLMGPSNSDTDIIMFDVTADCW